MTALHSLNVPYETLNSPDHDNTILSSSFTQANVKKPPLRCSCCCGGFHLSSFRYYLCLCASCTVLTALLLIIFIYAFIPIIIRSQIDAVQINFQYIDITNPNSGNITLPHLVSPSNSGDPSSLPSLPSSSSSSSSTTSSLPSLTLNVIGELSGVESVVSVQLSSMVLSLSQVSVVEQNGSYVEQLRYLSSVSMQPLLVSGTTSLHIQTDMAIEQLQNFDEFVQALVAQPTVTWQIDSYASVQPVHILGFISLPVVNDVHMQKRLTMIGCNGLQQVVMGPFDMSHSNETTIFIQANVSLFNPSIFNIQPLGDMHFYVLYEDAVIGSLFSRNTSMLAGWNNISFYGWLHPHDHDMPIVDRLIRNYVSGVTSRVSAVAAPDVSSIPLYNQGLQGLNLTTYLPGISYGLVGELLANNITLIPSFLDQTVQFNGGFNFSILSPLGPHSPLIIVDMSLDIAVLWTDPLTPDYNITLGRLYTLDSHVIPLYDNDTQTVTFTFQSKLEAILEIHNTTAYQRFIDVFVESNMVTVYFQGDASVNASSALGMLHLNDVPITTALSMSALQGLSDTDEKTLSVLGNRDCKAAGVPSPCGLDTQLLATINNPSVVSVDLRTSDFNLFWNRSNTLIRLGSVHTNVSLTTGLNQILANGYLFPAPEDLPAISLFLSEYVSGGNHSMVLAGMPDPPPMYNNSAHSITTQCTSVRATCRGVKMTLLQNFDLGYFRLMFRQGPNAVESVNNSNTVWASAGVSADLLFPDNFNVPLTVLNTDFSVDVNALLSGQSWSDLGHMYVPRVSVLNTPPHHVQMEFLDIPFPVSNVSGFQAFVHNILSTPSATFDLSGLANPKAATAMGEIELTNIALSAEFQLMGLNNFADPSGQSLMHLSNLYVISSTSDYVELSAQVDLLNPTNLIVEGVGMLQFDMYFQGVRLARISLDDFALYLGANKYIGYGRFYQPDDAPGRAVAKSFLSNFLNHQNQSISLSGSLLLPNGSYTPGTSLPLLAPAVANMNIQTMVPGSMVMFATHLTVHLTWAEALQILAHGGGIVPAKARLFNPFATPIYIEQANFTVIANGLDGTPSGYWAFSNNTIEVPPNSPIDTVFEPVYLIPNLAVVAELIRILFDPPVNVSLSGNMVVRMTDPDTGFLQELFVQVGDIPTTLGDSLSNIEQDQFDAWKNKFDFMKKLERDMQEKSEDILHQPAHSHEHEYQQKQEPIQT